MIHVLTRVSAPLGIDVRVDAGCVDVFGINGMPPVVTFGLITSFRNTFKPIRTPFIVVRMGPAIFVRVPELVTRFKGIFMARPNPSTGGFTNPTKSIRRRKTGMFNLRRGNDMALRRGGFFIPQPDCATCQPEQHHTRTHNRHRPPLRTRIHSRWWKVGGNEGNRSDIFVTSRRILVRHYVSIRLSRRRCCLCICFVVFWLRVVFGYVIYFLLFMKKYYLFKIKSQFDTNE